MDWRKPFRPFLDMTYLGIPDLTSGEGLIALDDFVPGRGRGRLLLGTYGEEEIRDALARYGIREQIRKLGFADVNVCIDAADPDRQQVRFFPVLDPLNHQRQAQACAADSSEFVADIILREAILSPSEDLIPNPRPFNFLVIQWICLQNPMETTDPKDLLPGQKYIGLGLGAEVMEMLINLSHVRHLEGIVNRPEFVHNALLYSRYFKYLNPESEGRLRALQRDLADLNLRQVAWAVEKGWVREDSNGTFFRWYQAEQVWPNSDELNLYFSGEDYRKKVDEVRERARYELDEGAMEKLAEICN